MGDTNFSDLPQWTAAAEAKLQKIPFFARSQARQRIEDMARQEAMEIITADLVERVRSQFGQ